MNSTHDLGGMHGFGAIDRSQQENFAEPWEQKVFALTLACGMLGQWNLDESRFAREQMDPGDYLKSGYYEHWLHGLELLLVEKGLVSKRELDSTMSESPSTMTATRAEMVGGILERGGPTQLPECSPGRFVVDDSVVVRNFNPKSHTRAPRYIRGRKGRVVAHYGAHIFPDQHALDGEKVPVHLYNVRFEAEELWGVEDAQHHSPVFVDVFEPYLDSSNV